MPSVLTAALQVAAAPPQPEPEPPPIPPELARKLGRDGVQALWDYGPTDPTWIFVDKSEDWWKLLPWLVRSTLIERDGAFFQGKQSAWQAIADTSEHECERLVAKAEQICVLQREQIGLLKRRNEQLETRVAQLEAAAKAAGIAPPEPAAGDKRARS